MALFQSGSFSVHFDECGYAVRKYGKTGAYEFFGFYKTQQEAEDRILELAGKEYCQLVKF